MQIKIRKFNQDGADYISVERTEDGKILERSFETYPLDQIETILSLLEANINIIIK
jgi:hypothetical protein